MGAGGFLAAGAGGVALLLATATCFLLSSGTSEAGCGATITATAVASTEAVAGYSGEQLVNAASIINAASALGLDSRADLIGVMTAMGESGLRNLDYGDERFGVVNSDGTATDSVGVFQQQHWWGTLAQRMDPAAAATAFFVRVQALAGWQSMEPGAVAHAVQGNADPHHYDPFVEPATQVVAALVGKTSGCSVGGDAQTIAQQLVVAADAGKLVDLRADHIKEIRWIAEGKVVPDCGIDLRILQVILLTVNHFDRVGVSSINRKCTGEASLGTTSRHYADGGGHAVDFYMLNGQYLTGADGQSLRLIALLDPMMPAESRVGQSNCRRDAGDAVELNRWIEIADFCNHLHIDLVPVDEWRFN